ncbi:hypothetical protein AB3S75_017194 [Citrus x aurantiifolia]
MGDPDNSLLPPLSSPTNTVSSIYSSDLDTESTGSFFHDRSTTLGTLMGVSFPAITFRGASQSQSQSQQQRDMHVTDAPSGTRGKKKSKKRASPIISASTARRRWWRLCGDDEDAKPSASLGDFLEVERRFGDTTTFYNAAAELEGVVVSHQHQHPSNGRLLFADGRVLPPADAVAYAGETSSTADFLCTGICR